MENSVIGFRFAINISVSYTESYCFYPMTKIFYKDGTSGWHGHKNGLALFYVDQQHFQQEFHELAAAGIIVLLVVLLLMNSTAIYIRNKTEKRIR